MVESTARQSAYGFIWPLGLLDLLYTNENTAQEMCLSHFLICIQMSLFFRYTSSLVSWVYIRNWKTRLCIFFLMFRAIFCYSTFLNITSRNSSHFLNATAMCKSKSIQLWCFKSWEENFLRFRALELLMVSHIVCPIKVEIPLSHLSISVFPITHPLLTFPVKRLGFSFDG